MNEIPFSANNPEIRFSEHIFFVAHLPNNDIDCMSVHHLNRMIIDLVMEYEQRYLTLAKNDIDEARNDIDCIINHRDSFAPRRDQMFGWLAQEQQQMRDEYDRQEEEYHAEMEKKERAKANTLVQSFHDMKEPF